MRRRAFTTLLGGAATWPLGARAQQMSFPVIGWLGSVSRDTFGRQVASFHQGIAESGFVEGKTVTVEYRWAEGQYDRLPALAAELVRRQVAVILSSGGIRPALAAKSATSNIPIVFLSGGGDPVQVMPSSLVKLRFRRFTAIEFSRAPRADLDSTQAYVISRPDPMPAPVAGGPSPIPPEPHEGLLVDLGTLVKSGWHHCKPCSLRGSPPGTTDVDRSTKIQVHLLDRTRTFLSSCLLVCSSS